MSDKRALVEKAQQLGFFLARGAGGAEQLRRKVKGGRWIVVTAEDDTLALPPSLRSRANRAVLPKHPDQNPDPIKETVFETALAALASVE